MKKEIAGQKSEEKKMTVMILGALKGTFDYNSSISLIELSRRTGISIKKLENHVEKLKKKGMLNTEFGVQTAHELGIRRSRVKVKLIYLI